MCHNIMFYFIVNDLYKKNFRLLILITEVFCTFCTYSNASPLSF